MVTAVLVLALNALSLVHLHYRQVGPAIFFSTAGLIISLSSL
jgi:hypothetical protein